MRPNSLVALFLTTSLMVLRLVIVGIVMVQAERDRKRKEASEAVQRRISEALREKEELLKVTEAFATQDI